MILSGWLILRNKICNDINTNILYNNSASFNKLIKNDMKPLITLPAHFDGKAIILDAPFKLESDTKLLVTVLRSGNHAEEKDEWNVSSSLQLNKAYSEDEPEYSLSLVKEPNPEYKK